MAATKNGDALGMIEITSMAMGMQAQDAMLKAADVRLLIARSICSGKYIVVVGGNVAAVKASVSAGVNVCPDGIIDSMVIPNIHPDVFAALGQMVQLSTGGKGAVPAMGVVETFSASSALQAADSAAKAANVQLLRLHVAMAMGGKGLIVMSGTIGDVRAGVAAAAEVVREKGLLVAAVTIPGPSRELFQEYL